MREKDKICHYKALEKLSTQELDRLLQEELRRETPNEEVVLPILQVLQEREAEHPVEISNDTEDAWNTYRDHVGSYVPVTPVRKRDWIIKVAAVAAIVCVLIMAIPNTVGAESVFDVLIRWTESVFEFLKPGENNDPPVEYVFQTDNPGLQQLYDKVVEMGITEPVVPMWLPEGYELVELKQSRIEQGVNTFAKFVNGDNVVLFTYWTPPRTISVQYEKNDIEMEVVEIEGTQYFVLVNNNYNSLMWVKDNVECHINAGLSKNEMYKLIDSIYMVGG